MQNIWFLRFKNINTNAFNDSEWIIFSENKNRDAMPELTKIA